MSQREARGRGARDDVETLPDPDAARGVLPPLVIGRYDIGACIGKGGMGEVYHARDVSIGRDVAIKRMLDPIASQRALARFVREARIQAILDHPAIVPVHDLGLDNDGLPYIVMKRLSGLTMREALDREVSKQRLLRAFVEVCFAVEYAHVRGVVHRDLKPENIMLGDFGEVYVLDWGVAKVLDLDDDIDASAEVAFGRELVTRAGSVIGTREYMAPEQAHGEPIDARADVYSLGRILFELLAGSDDAAPRPSEIACGVPTELDDLCARALAQDRDERLASVYELALGVQRYLDGDRDHEHRRLLAGEHLARARAALAAGDDPDHRSLAMREANRALALDPMRTEAADLIGRLMLEPPAQVPPEVEEALAAERMAVRRRNARAATTGIVALVVMTQLIYAATAARWTDVVGIDLLALAFLGVTRFALRVTQLARMVSVFAAIGLAAIVMLVATLYPPFVVAPVLASQIAIVTPFTMQHEQRWFSVYVTLLMIAAVALPYLGEHAGWFARTSTHTEAGVLLHTPSLRGDPTAQIAIGAGYIVVSIAFAGWMGYVTRQSERGARRRLHLQAWHLRQLVISR